MLKRPGKQIKGHRGGGGEEAREGVLFGRKRQPQTRRERAGARHENPTRARGLKMLALNSSILVAAPRWRRSLVSVVSLGTGTSAGRPAKWRNAIQRHPRFGYSLRREVVASKKATGSSQEAQS